MAGNVATVLLDLTANLDNLEVANLLMCCDEMIGKQFANLGV